MNSKSKEYLDEYVYNCINDLCDSSPKYKELSENLKERLSELLEPIGNDECNEILYDFDEINKFLIKIDNLSSNELTMIKDNGKILIEKYRKHKEKILSLKTKNNSLEEELTNANEQKEKALAKYDELNDEYYKLYQEKNSIESKISLKEEDEKEKYKLNNKILNEEIKNLNDTIEKLNKEINFSSQKIKDLTKKNEEISENNSIIEKELEYKNVIVEQSLNKFKKLSEENDSIRLMNKGLQNTIEELDNQCRKYETKIKQLDEKIENYEKYYDEKKINLFSIIDGEDKKEQSFDDDLYSDNGINEITGNKKKRRNGVDYTSMGINLNDLIDENQSSEIEDNKTTSDLNKMKSGIKSPNKYRKVSNDTKSDKFVTPKKAIPQRELENIINSKVGAQILLKLKDYKNTKDNKIRKIKFKKNDEAFLSELLFRLLDY